MKTLKVVIILIMAAPSFSGCTEYPIYDITYPKYGKIISLTTNWMNRGSNIEIPASYTLKVGDYSTILSGTANPVENLFSAGKHIINIWNTAGNIFVSDRIATADYAAGNLEWFFTGRQEIVIEKNRDYSIIVAMQQQVRQLTLELDVTGDAKNRLTDIDAILTGVAGTLDIDDGTHGTPSNVALMFAEDPLEGKWKVTVRLLGITGPTRILMLKLNFAGSNPSAYTLSSDLSSLLAAFNTDKTNPLTLSARLIETPSGAGITTIITDWISEGTSSGTAN